LHFATKFGSYEVAKLLMSFDICSRNAVNKFDKKPEDIICSKAVNETSKSNYSKIKSLFEDIFYVPLYRDEDRGDVIMEKPSVKLAQNITPSETTVEPANRMPLSNIKPSSNLLNITQHKLAGYIGPVSPTIVSFIQYIQKRKSFDLLFQTLFKANDIYEKFKSPARLRNSPLNKDILRGDDIKGYERILRKITDELHLPWSEYWSFLDAYCNFQGKEGLDKLEMYFRQKKFQQILEAQQRSTQSLIGDLTSNNKTHESEHLLTKLNSFIHYVDQLKSNLDLKENQLSPKYERFVNFMKDHQNTNLSDLLKSGEDLNANSDLLNDPNVSHHNEINSTLTRYMSAIIELSRIDKSSKCYFNLYKTSKVLLEMLNCQELFNSFYLSPVFQNRTVYMTSNMKNGQQRDVNAARARFMGNVAKSISFDDDEDDDPKKNRPTNGHRTTSDIELNEEDDDSENKQIMFDAEDSQIDDEHDQKKSKDDDLDVLTSAMQANRLVTSPDQAPKPKTNGFKNPFGGGSLSQELVAAKENSQPSVNLNLKNNSEALGSSKKTTTGPINSQLFVFGEAPSKLDRAVYLAIQDLKDRSRYPLIAQWYDYMKNCKQSEMQQWKTPARKNTFSRLY
jgi:hypothetical protein